MTATTSSAASPRRSARQDTPAVTASAGVAAAADVEIGVLLEAADRALYRAKEAGKNQVQVEAP